MKFRERARFQKQKLVSEREWIVSETIEQSSASHRGSTEIMEASGSCWPDVGSIKFSMQAPGV